MNTYMTEARQVIAETLPRDTPYAIRCVSQGIFSIARHYGGATYNGASYTYIPETDELVRNDVVKAIQKAERKPRRAKAAPLCE